MIKVNGATHPDAIPILMNSPDITADLQVNLQDVPAFAADFHNPTVDYFFRSDLVFDKLVNVADIPGLAANMDKACP